MINGAQDRVRTCVPSVNSRVLRTNRAPQAKIFKILASNSYFIFLIVKLKFSLVQLKSSYQLEFISLVRKYRIYQFSQKNIVFSLVIQFIYYLTEDYLFRLFNYYVERILVKFSYQLVILVQLEKYNYQLDKIVVIRFQLLDVFNEIQVLFRISYIHIVFKCLTYSERI